MSSRFRASLLLIGAAALTLAACDREEHHSRSKPIGETVPAGSSPQTIYPGESGPPAIDARAKLFDNNANAISMGQTLYTQMNCVGCHAHGGGGIGPPLIDETWIYGSDIRNIFATISEGRPNGMPSFRGKIPPEQIWQIAAYVRSMAGLTPKQASPSRPDHLQAKASESSTPPQPPSGGTIPPAATAPQ